ncbi:transcription elongation regulator 1-like isoform X3 [Cydia strobilella]|uniref:transcription elongation regulator 1-like isoform X3 n=1 Tax=Cydia strobilella TaxID=1100964 RepID=UPI003006E85C
MEEEYVDAQDSGMNEAVNRGSDGNDNIGDGSKDFGDMSYDDGYEDDDGGNGFRGGRGRGNFRGRGRGPPPGWMNGPPPMRFRGRGYGPGGPPMRGRGFFRGRPRFNNNYDTNWGPMPPPMMGGPFGPPPHGMMGPGPMGPPPNMMGQPPFGPPPNMPPPNMPAPELWVETKSEEGKSYYYHARTRETTWTRPQESPTCKVITQAEMEAMAAAGQMPPGGMANPAGMGMGGPLAGMGGMAPGMMQPPGALPPFMTQPPPWLKDGGKPENKPEARSPSENDDSPPGERSPALQPPNGNMKFPPSAGAPGAFQTGAGPPPQGFAPPQGFPNNPPPGFNNPPGFAGVPGGPGVPGVPGAAGGPGAVPGGPVPGGPVPGGPVPGGPGGMSGAWGGWGGWPPPLVAQPPPNLSNANVPNAGAATAVPGTSEPVEQPVAVQPPPKKEETVVPPALAAAAAEWSAHRAPDGRPYYYNAGKGESVWEKPKPMKDLEELQAKIAEEKGEKPEKDKMDIDGKVEVIDVEAHAEAAAAAEAERVRLQQERDTADREAAEREAAEQEKKEKEEKEKEKAKRKNKPISIMPISGTPWCLVWSGDGRVFFYNPTAHTSFWERPEQLIGRADVDRAMACPPAAVTQYFQRKEASTTPTTPKPANGELKRSADSSSDDSDAEPAKKAKPEEAAAKKPASTTSSSLIDAGKEARIEAEARAARQRALVPLDQRVRVFRQMLQERDVSAFSTWEKELKKIVCDCRYLLLTSEERKQVYNKYVRERAEEERKEKKNKLLQKKNSYKQLMEEAKLHSKSSFNEFSSKHGRDERFKGIDKPRDRVTYFNEHVAELRKREKDDKERKREQAKTDFIALLKEKSIDRHARWADAKKKVDSEARYKAVESSTLREDYFREYCKIVKEERKKDKDQKEKERDRSSSKKEKKDKERDKDKDKEKDKEEKRDKDGKKDKKKEKASEPEAATGSEAEAEADPEAEAGSDAESEAARERAARAQASIKEREREVQRALATSLRDRDKEREYHKRDEAVQHFNALLADLVRNPDLAWREAKKQLKKDHRYTAAELLTKEDKERLFASHTGTLATRRRDKLRTLLTEMGVAPTAHWRDVRARLRAEPAAPVYTSADKMEREFRDFQRDRQSAAKTALRQLLQETRSITHKTLASVKDAAGGEQLQPVHDMLKHDARYLALEHIPEERASIIEQYVSELAHKGPPPPPTATEPSRRSKQ